MSESCPSRGTWIEIAPTYAQDKRHRKSCPSRGTWIEIISVLNLGCSGKVVPLAGHVD